MAKNGFFLNVITCSGIIASAYGFGIYLFGTIAPDMRQDLNITNADLGIISSASQAGLMASAFFTGFFCSKIGYARVILFAQFISAFSLFSLAYFTNFYLVVAVNTLLGICAAATWVAMVPFAQAFVPENYRAAALGVMASGTAFGVFVNGFLAPALINNFGWREVWTVTGIIALGLGFFALFLFNRDSSSRKKEIDTGLNHSYTYNIDLGTTIAVAITFINGLAFLPFQTYLTSLLRDYHGWSMARATFMWSIIGFGGMIGGLAFGIVADRITSRRAMSIAYSILYTSCLSVSYISDEYILLYIGLFFGLAYNAIFGLMAAYISDYFDARSAGMITGFTFVALGVGSMLGNFFGGVITSFSNGYYILYTAISVLVFLNLSLSFILPKPLKN